MKKQKTKVTQLRQRSSTRKMVTKKRRRKRSIEDIEVIVIEFLGCMSYFVNVLPDLTQGSTFCRDFWDLIAIK